MRPSESRNSWQVAPVGRRQKRCPIVSTFQPMPCTVSVFPKLNVIGVVEAKDVSWDVHPQQASRVRMLPWQVSHAFSSRMRWHACTDAFSHSDSVGYTLSEPNDCASALVRLCKQCNLVGTPPGEETDVRARWLLEREASQRCPRFLLDLLLLLICPRPAAPSPLARHDHFLHLVIRFHIHDVFIPELGRLLQQRRLQIRTAPVAQLRSQRLSARSLAAQHSTTQAPTLPRATWPSLQEVQQLPRNPELILRHRPALLHPA